MQKRYVFGGFGYHVNLLAFFGFWFLVCRVSNFVRRYSTSGLECPLGGSITISLGIGTDMS